MHLPSPTLMTLLATLPPLLLTYYLFRFTTAYLLARKIGLPIYLTPVNPQSALWLIFSVPLRPLLKALLPETLLMRFEVTIYGFENRLRDKPLRVLGGDSYVLVGPGKVEVWTADREAARDVIADKGVGLSEMSMKFMNRFGPNVLTCQGESWQRQRRIIAPIINESVSASVWAEGSTQAVEMLESFLSAPKPVNGHSKLSSPTPDSTSGAGVTTASIEGLRRIAINVLGSVGYGKPQAWSAPPEAPGPGYTLSYMDSLFAIVNNTAAAVLVPPWLMCLPIWPRSVRRLGDAVREYPEHNRAMVAGERKLAEEDVEVDEKGGREKKNNLMSVIVKLSDEEKKAQGREGAKGGVGGKRLYLEEEEIYGNLFLFTLAGFDTTANTMAYALVNLVLEPKWQDWICEEIDAVMPDTDVGATPDYAATFPKLKRCLALMFETLRLYTPVQHLARESHLPVHFATSTGTRHTVPAGTNMFVSSAMIHVNSSYWGPDPLAFRPTRWLTTTSHSHSSSSSSVSASGSEVGAGQSGVGKETLVEPPRGTFLPWSIGPRNCPGQKMSQVEFVSVFAALFRHARAEIALGAGESAEEGRRRIWRVVEDSQPLITLQMNEPGKVGVRWVMR